VNARIRRAVKVRLAELDMTQADLAERVGVKPQYVSDILTGKVGKVPDAWQKILEALDLELVTSKKGEA
jgi:transcriptional regulator with XRE-family HTH domain